MKQDEIEPNKKNKYNNRENMSVNMEPKEYHLVPKIS